MQVQVKQLISELQWVKKFAEKKATIPVIQNILFEAHDGRINLTATNLEIGGVTYVNGTGDDNWAIAAPISKLIQYLQKVDESEVNLKPNDAHWLCVTHGAAATRVAGMSKESFPELPTSPDPVVTLGRLPLAVDRVAFAISKEESRFTLNGALLEIENGKALLLATDGHRLSAAPLQSKGVDALKLMLPKDAWVEAGNLDGECTLAVDENYGFFSWGQRRIVSRKLTGNFPDWRRVMPTEATGHVMLPVKTTMRTLDRVALYSDDRSHAVRFTIDGLGKLVIFASSVEQGEAEGTIPYQGGEVCGPFQGGYNAKYVLDFLRATDSQNVAFCWQADTRSADVREQQPGNPHAAVFATADHWRYAVMPMKI